MARPRKYETVEQLESAIEAYFEDAESREVPYTVEGLAVACGVDRRTILNYEKTDEFFPTIKEAKDKVLQHLQEYAIKGKYNSAMTIFNLKNNYGFVDKKEVETSGKTDTELTVNIVEDRQGE